MSMLWQRQLDTYPSTGKRMWYLAIVVLATILLYYEFYTQGAVAPEILRQYGMSFHFYVYITVIANQVGAFASAIAGLADRWGRANLVAYGLLITGLLVLFGIPNAPNEWSYGIILSAIGFVEGIILVATPALVRASHPSSVACFRDGLLDPRAGDREPDRLGGSEPHPAAPSRLAGSKSPSAGWLASACSCWRCLASG